MSDLLYLFESLILNLGEMIRILGGIIFVLGLLDAFFGYKLFNMMLAITGFLVGAIVGLMILINAGIDITDRGALTTYILIGGIVGASLAGIFHKVGVFIVVGAMGIIIFLLATQNIQVSLVFGIICGIVGVFLEKYIIIIATALSGGGLAAIGIWFIGIANGDDINFGAIVWLIGIGGMIFQFWLEKRIPKEAVADTLLGDLIEDILDGIVFIISLLGRSLYCLIKDPKGVIHAFVYKADSDEINPILVVFCLGIPIVVGTIVGVMFKSLVLALGVVALIYVLWVALYVKKRKAEVLPGGYVPKYTWESWINRVMDSEIFLFFVLFVMPFFPALFLSSFINNSAISAILALFGIVGSYIVLFKIIDSLPAKGSTHPDLCEDKSIDKQQGDMMGVKKKADKTKAELENKEADAGLKLLTKPESRLNTYDEIHMITCSSCGKMINADANFCNFCGSKVIPIDMIVCKNCGKSITKDANFCYYCGEKIRKDI